LVLLTGASKHSSPAASWPDHLPSNATLIIYMPGHELSELQARLLGAGVLAAMPCAIISGATSESEQVDITTVRNLAGSQSLGAPRLVVVGEVVRLADPERLKQHFREFSTSEDHREPGFGSAGE
jgi:siroheme synthase